MYGVAIGDLLGSKYEFNNIKTKDFELFQPDMFVTDDTVMTCAVIETLLDGVEPVESFLKWYRRYPRESYGGGFRNWLENRGSYKSRSCGNGSAMRVSPVGWLAKTKEEVVSNSRLVTWNSHFNPDGFRGAEATAMMVFWAKSGMKKKDMEENFKGLYYNEHIDLNKVRNDPTYWGELCYNTVPQAMECFFSSENFEDCIRNCISIGGDSDTIGAIAGGVAEAYYGVPEDFLEKLYDYLPDDIAKTLARLYKESEKDE